MNTASVITRELEPVSLSELDEGTIEHVHRPAAGYEGIAEAIIAQACNDYQKLAEAGLVKGDKVKLPFKRTKILEGDYMHESQARQLISWLRDGGLKDLLDMSHLKINEGWLLTEIGVRSRSSQPTG